MSANMVTKQHIDILVGAALEIAHDSSDRMKYSWPGHFGYRVVYLKTADSIGKMLWATNWSGLNHYYGFHGHQDDWFADIKGYTYRESDLLADMSIGGLIKQVHCYTYQASEAPGWEHSEAKAFCDELVDSLTYQLTEYQDAGWGIPEYDDIVEAREAEHQRAMYPDDNPRGGLVEGASEPQRSPQRPGAGDPRHLQGAPTQDHL